MTRLTHESRKHRFLRGQPPSVCHPLCLGAPPRTLMSHCSLFEGDICEPPLCVRRWWLGSTECDIAPHLHCKSAGEHSFRCRWEAEYVQQQTVPDPSCPSHPSGSDLPSSPVFVTFPIAMTECLAEATSKMKGSLCFMVLEGFQYTMVGEGMPVGTCPG